MSDQASIRNAIDQANRELTDAFNRGDQAGMARCYTDDAQLLAPNHEPFSGPAAVAAVLGALRGEDGSVELETLKLEGQGDLAWEQGGYVIRGGSGEERDRGKYIVIWKQVDGRWRLHRDMISTNLPAA